jgi:DNA-binding response OmpR family regulator
MITAPVGRTSADSPRILVVEDDPDIRQFLQDCLQAKGYRVRTAVDGLHALDAVHADTFEGMILDIGIPSLDGMEVLQKIRRWDQQIPIVMVTASDSKESAVRAISMGAQAYMLKPFDIDELQRVADYWFRPLERQPTDSSGDSTPPGQ